MATVIETHLSERITWRLDSLGWLSRSHRELDVAPSEPMTDL